MSDGEELPETRSRTTDPSTETDATREDTVPERVKPTSESLSRRIREKGGHRGSVTRNISDVHYAVETGNTNKLKRLRKTLTEKFELLIELDREILKEIAEDKLEDEVERCDIVREGIEDALMEIDEALEKLALSQARKKPTHHRRHHRIEEEDAQTNSTSSEQSSGEGEEETRETPKTTTVSVTTVCTSMSTTTSPSYVESSMITDTVVLPHETVASAMTPASDVMSAHHLPSTTYTSTLASGRGVSFTGYRLNHLSGLLLLPFHFRVLHHRS